MQKFAVREAMLHLGMIREPGSGIDACPSQRGDQGPPATCGRGATPRRAACLEAGPHLAPELGASTGFGRTVDHGRSLVPWPAECESAGVRESQRPDVTALEIVGGIEKRELVIAEYESNWPVIYERHEARIRAALGTTALQIEHIGSTAVPGLAAKPIIDILVTVGDITSQRRRRDAPPRRARKRAKIGSSGFLPPRP